MITLRKPRLRREDLEGRASRLYDGERVHVYGVCIAGRGGPGGALPPRGYAGGRSVDLDGRRVVGGSALFRQERRRRHFPSGEFRIKRRAGVPSEIDHPVRAGIGGVVGSSVGGVYDYRSGRRRSGNGKWLDDGGRLDSGERNLARRSHGLAYGHRRSGTATGVVGKRNARSGYEVCDVRSRSVRTHDYGVGGQCCDSGVGNGYVSGNRPIRRNAARVGNHHLRARSGGQFRQCDSRRGVDVGVRYGSVGEHRARYRSGVRSGHNAGDHSRLSVDGGYPTQVGETVPGRRTVAELQFSGVGFSAQFALC